MGVPAMNAVGGRISQATIDAVRERADLVELVEARTGPGRPSRGQMMLRCPFHDERTPSFHVHPGDKLYKCFGCGEQGGAVRFRPQDREPQLPRGRRVAGRPVRRRGRARGPVARRPRPARSRQARRRSARRRHLLLRALPGARGGERGGARLPGRARRLGRVDRALPARLRAVRLGPRGALRALEGLPDRAAVRGRRLLAGPPRADRPLPRADHVPALRRPRPRARVRREGDARRRGAEVPEQPRVRDLQEEPHPLRPAPRRARRSRRSTARSWSRATPT